MKKTFYLLLIILMMLLTLFLLTINSKAANISVDQVKGLSVASTATTTINLKWDKVKNISGYKVYTYNSKTKKYEYYGHTSKNSLEMKNLYSAKIYKIKVRAYKTKNNKNYYGKYSSHITCATNPKRVKNIIAKSKTASKITIKWDEVARANGYKVYKYNSKTKKYEYYGYTNKNSITVTDLESATSYKFKVRAYKTVKKVKYFGEYSKATLYTRPKTIKKIFVKENNVESITLQWNKIERINGYRVYIYNKDKEAWQYYKQTTDNYITIYKDKVSTNKFKVRAYTMFGEETSYGKYSPIVPIRKGIDVSGYQDKIDWEKVKNDGIEFAIIRCGGRYYGTSGTIYSDSTFERNIKEARKHELEVGIYFFSAAITEKEAIAEANWCIKRLKKYGMENECKYIAYDFEVFGRGRAENLSKKQLNKNTIAFMNRVLEEGYTPILYGNMTYLTKYFDLEKIKANVSNYKIWLAHYVPEGQDTTYQGNYDIWQYTSTGKVDGISGDADLDIVYF